MAEDSKHRLEAIRKALDSFVDDSGYVRHRFAVADDHATCDDGELVKSCESFCEAVLAWERLTAEDPEASLSITGWGHGTLARHHQVKDLFASARGTFECPICGEDTPHAHTQAEIDADREVNLRLQSMRDADRTEIMSRAANVEKLYGQRPRLAKAVLAVEAALAASPDEPGAGT